MMDHFGDPPTTLTESLAREGVRRITHHVIRDLQQLRGGHVQSGADSGLRDVWDEICVQVQFEQSPLWASYVGVLEVIVERHASRVAPTRLYTIWLETDSGQDWLDEIEDASDGESDVRTYCLEDVVEYLRDQVLGLAADWSNVRIRRYLERW